MRNDFRNDFCHVCDGIQYDSRILLLCVRACVFESDRTRDLSKCCSMLQYFSLNCTLHSCTMGALCLFAFWMLSIINLSRSHLCVLFASNYFNVHWRALYICLSALFCFISHSLFYYISIARTNTHTHSESFSLTRICTSINFLCAVQIHC